MTNLIPVVLIQLFDKIVMRIILKNLQQKIKDDNWLKAQCIYTDRSKFAEGVGCAFKNLIQTSL